MSIDNLKHGKTALIEAKKKRHQECITELLKAGADDLIDGTCNQCIFPLSKEDTKTTGICDTHTSLVYATRDREASLCEGVD